ncbi:2-hydroxyacylsphingosine 1-beta-galactosyltransferase [Apiospora sp. TS-2023a]
MSRRKLGVVAAVATALLAWAVHLYQQAQEHGTQQSGADTVPGINNTVLFLVTGVHGLSNVHFATIQALLERHPHIEVHFATPTSDTDGTDGVNGRNVAKLARIASFARSVNPAARDVAFHHLPGPSWVRALKQNTDVGVETLTQPPNYRGVALLSEQFQHSIAPWTGEEYLRIYRAARALIEEVDPAVVVLDTLFMPGVDAARKARRLQAFVTPNTLIENFVAEQPWLGMLWKYPIVGADFGFPVPWRHVPENALSAFRLVWSVLNMPAIKARQRFLQEQGGIKEPINFYKLHRPNVPWVTQTTEGASIPVDVVPPNVTCAGPIVLSAAPAAEQDAELAAWLAKGRGKTLLVNLGSSISVYSPKQASTMAAAIRATLDKHTDAQVLWKMLNARNRTEELKPLSDLVAGGRVKISGWIDVDPVSLLETGDILASVHHGGSNCYHEAIYAGVPQVILPLWADLYNFAALAETSGIGVYGSRGTAPSWTIEGLTNAFMGVVDDEKAAGMREKARKLSEKARARPGREVAAAEIARWAGSGRAYVL